MKKQPEVTTRTRQNLIDAFWELYCEKRIEKITIKEITTKADYNRCTFYEYFTDVYDILEQLEQSLLPDMEGIQMHDVFNQMEHQSNGQVSTIDFQHSFFFFEGFMELYKKHCKYLPVLLGDNGDPSFLVKLKKILKPKMKKFFIELGAKDDFVIDIFIEYNISAMNGVMCYWFSLEKRPSAKEFAQIIHELISGKVIESFNIPPHIIENLKHI